MAGISFNIAWKELKIAQISQLSTFAFSSYIRPRLLRVKLYANEEKCKQWRQQRFAYSMAVVQRLKPSHAIAVPNSIHKSKIH